MLNIADIPEDQIIFYDIETDHQFAPYCELKMIGAQDGFRGEPYLVETYAERQRFKEKLMDPNIIKVGFNIWNFDNIVLRRHGYNIEPEGVHDIFFMFKTVAPRLPSHSMKYIAWHYFGDPHFPEMELERWARVNRMSKWEAPRSLLKPYCLHDIVQTRTLFEIIWEVVQRPRHWEAYAMDNECGPIVDEMAMDGGLYLDGNKIEEEIATLQINKLAWEGEAWNVSKGKVRNPNSSDQLGAYLLSEGFEVDMTDDGNFSLPKDAILDFLPDLKDETKDHDRVVRCAFEIRQINAKLKYYEGYKRALNHSADHLRRGWIPRQYSLDGAKTRRTLSNSFYKINFQNPTKDAKKVQIVPDGWGGLWIDATQVENVVHIYESEDDARRAAYEADENWNEYVWLCNQILGGNRSKKELDSIPSPQFPGWSIYKQFKTIKLALNFGMGVDKFCLKTGVDKKTGKESFAIIHQACPAIKKLQDRIEADIRRNGFVQDVFGHIYEGEPRKAYKVVAYLVQGTGTGSLPKAQMGANLKTLRKWGGPDVCHFSGTTHDETEFRFNLRKLTAEQCYEITQELMYNMTDRFSGRFDGIPLRAKPAFSRTTAAAQEELDIVKDRDKVLAYFS